MSELTRVLSALEQGDPGAADRLLPLVYDELRKLAAQIQRVGRDGRRLASVAGGSHSLWEVVPGREARTLPSYRAEGKEEHARGGGSPDGRWLALGTSRGLRLWDLALGKEISLPPTPPAKGGRAPPRRDAGHRGDAPPCGGRRVLLP